MLFSSADANSNILESGDQDSSSSECGRSRPHSLLPSTLPTITAPSSYAMQILVPSLDHFMSRTTDLFLLFIISSNHKFLCTNHTIIKPYSSAVVNFLWCSFQVSTRTRPLCPSNDWLDIGGAPLLLSAVGSSKRNTFSIPFSPPQAIQPKL